MKTWIYVYIYMKFRIITISMLEFIVPSLVGICISRILPYLENNLCRVSSEHYIENIIRIASEQVIPAITLLIVNTLGIKVIGLSLV